MDYTVGDTIYHKFTTRAFATAIPTVLAGTPVLSAYEDGSVTQITAGVSVTANFDGVAGLNLMTIVATGANGFESGKQYGVVITTGTVDGVNAGGETIFNFTLEKSAAAIELANATDGLTALKTALDDIPTVAEFNARTLVSTSYFDPATDTVVNVTNVATLTGHTVQTGDSFARIGAAGAGLTAINLPNQIMDIVGNITGNLSGSVGSVTGAVGSVAAINTTGGAIDDVVLVATTVINADMRGTDSAATAANLATAQLDLDVLAGSDGATLATSQPNYAPNTVVPDAAGFLPTAVENRQEIDSNSVDLNSLLTNLATVDTTVNSIQTDLSNGTDGLGALKALIDTVNTDLSNGTDGLGALKTLIDTVNTDLSNGTDGLGALKTLIDTVNTDLSNGTDGLGALLTAIQSVMTTQITESYAADGAAPTPTQSLMLIQQVLTDYVIVGTTATIRKIDGIATAATLTLNDDADPSAVTRST